MSDPLPTLLATIERLDAAATKAPWRQHTDYPRVIVEAANPYESLLGLDSEDTAVVWKEADAQNIAFSRNTLAPLASMLRAAVEALEPFARYAEKMKPGPLPDTACVAVHHDNVNGDTEITIADLKRARAALATIRRMAEEVERG